MKSAREQLDRLLYVLPQAARPEGARIADLARALDVDASTILADIEEATARAFYLQRGAVEKFSLTLDGDVVRMHSASEFQRPARLSPAEAMALGLGLRVLAAEAEPARRAEILELASRLEAELVTPEIVVQPMTRQAIVREAEPYTHELAFGEDDYRGVVAEAIEQRVLCDMTYLKANAAEPSVRNVAPLRLLYANGHWYMSAIETTSEQARVYRLDRILDLRPTGKRHAYEAPAVAAGAFSADGGTRVTVRYSTSVARWLAERQGEQCEADGTLVLTHDVADMNWLVRHVLQYAGEAVVETAGARRAVADAVRAIA